MKAKYSLEQEQEENPNHSDGFGMYWSGFFTCLKEISFFLDSLHQEQDSVAERFAKIVRANLPEIGNNAQSQFEDLYLEITGTKMYGGYND